MKKKLFRNTSKGYLCVNIETVNNYFSITGELWSSERTFKSRNDRYFLMGGCIHELISKYFPKLRPIIALHLSSLEGVPMYALENGFYHYETMMGVAKYHKVEEGDKEKYFTVLCEHLRISPDELNVLLSEMEKVTEKKLHFASYINGLLPKWKEEAENALKMIESL